MDATPDRQPEPSIPHIPDGFAALIGPNGDQYIVPEFMIPATHQAFEAYHKQIELDVANAEGCVSSLFLPMIHFPVAFGLVGCD